MSNVLKICNNQTA